MIRILSSMSLDSSQTMNFKTLISKNSVVRNPCLLNIRKQIAILSISRINWKSSSTLVQLLWDSLMKSKKRSILSIERLQKKKLPYLIMKTWWLQWSMKMKLRLNLMISNQNSLLHLSYLFRFVRRLQFSMISSSVRIK